ncbi:translation initiation factor IF-2 [Mycolicibacterium phlei]|jgi:hypothetical protein|uniref:Translation initiation factor IF-2 n=2 Tax=Mycolicibacterium TaxID=1866885 RepID=A0A5N5VF72_MYCPH|nr:type VII secretion target [Mycolicibacterium phlei]VEG11808.1 translation initiation factor IF-2 [Mycobacteroides chelonae]AMO63715.1 hypothetical protein MPHLCCUG_04930 [Mycolicibacterium phlei]EID16481.1 hypothetical protein MPHLEI_05757 [Mycolicibacterium phlei RIVM601174]KAB7759457.1 hypothetical protein MPHL21000_00015 [Mycolicibacterium phlei DSM 43239 = CCUG 21000]KXW60068.1 hypothetical protein MPHL43072_10295 [Mycolicibacterium phlei DSM 43072]
MTETLRVDTELVQQAGARLQSIAQGIPEPPTPYRPAFCTDALSAAIAAKVSEVVDPVIAQMPLTKEALVRYAHNVVNAANTYDAVDRQLAEAILKRLEQFDGAADRDRGSAAGGGGAAAIPAASGSGSGAYTASPEPTTASAQPALGAPSAGQGMPMPMGLAQQAAQAPMQIGGMLGAVPQAAHQAAQQAMQQAGQLSSMIGDSAEKDSSEDETAAREPGDEPGEDQAAAGEAREHVPDELAQYPAERKQDEAGPEIAL